MEMLQETLSFATKGFVIFVTVVVTVAVVMAMTRRRRGGRGQLEVRKLNERFEALGDALRHSVGDKQALKALHRERKQQKALKAAARPSVYVVDFDGDLLASAVKSLRDEVSAIAAVGKEGDEVVVRLESPGGAVPHYGLAAAQLVRLRDKKLKVTVCVDRIAASGGYMMACVADRVVAAPFAVIGSIGVVASIPNLHRLLKKHDVDFEELTAGAHKRTVTVFGEVTAEKRQKLQSQLDEMHGLFKDFVKAQRPALDVEKVATGEFWLAKKGLELGLVDQLGTSDDYLIARAADANVYQVRYTPPRPWRERLGVAGAEALDRAVVTLLTRAKGLELT